MYSAQVHVFVGVGVWVWVYDCSCLAGLPKEPEGEEEWFCPVCRVCQPWSLDLMSSSLCGLSLQNIDRRTKRSRPPNLKELLLLAVRRMMFPGVRQLSLFVISVSHYVVGEMCTYFLSCQTEIFQKPVPSDIIKHYREYIFFPMYLDRIKEVSPLLLLQ